jgi:hypothetical protein
MFDRVGILRAELTSAPTSRMTPAILLVRTRARNGRDREPMPVHENCDQLKREENLMLSRCMLGAVASLAMGTIATGNAFAQDSVKIGLIVAMTSQPVDRNCFWE